MSAMSAMRLPLLQTPQGLLRYGRTTGDARHRVAMLQENVIGDKDFITPCREKCDGEFVRELGRQ
jgi:hypothetical protein